MNRGLFGGGLGRANLHVRTRPLRLHSYLVAAVSISFEHLLEVNGDLGTMGTGSVGLIPGGSQWPSPVPVANFRRGAEGSLAGPG